MAYSGLCGSSSRHISKELGVCLECIRSRPSDALPVAMKAHIRSRAALGYFNKVV